MDIMEEHQAKVDFIAAMDNKYDYSVYRDFCIASGFEVMTFTQYADYIEPAVEPPQHNVSKGLGDTIAKITSAVGIKPCGSCKERQAALNNWFPYEQ